MQQLNWCKQKKKKKESNIRKKAANCVSTQLLFAEGIMHNRNDASSRNVFIWHAYLFIKALYKKKKFWDLKSGTDVNKVAHRIVG